MRLFFILICILFLIVLSCGDCKAEVVDFETPYWGIGYASGYRVPYRGIIVNEEGWEAIWNYHAKVDPSPTPIPEIDFDSYMLVVNFRGSYPTTGYHVRFFAVYYNPANYTMTFFYWVNYWIPLRFGTDPIFTDPYHMILVPKNVRCEYRFVEVVWNYYYRWWEFI